MKCGTCRKVTAELDSLWDRLRLWIFNRFHTDIIDLSQDKYTQGFSDGWKTGFKNAQEMEFKTEEALREEIFNLQKKLAKKNPLQELDEASILTVEKDLKTKKITKIYLGGEEVPLNLLKELQSEANALSKFKLWKIFQETTRNTAYKAMFEKSESFDDMKTGKGFLYVIGVLKNIVDSLQSIKTKV